MDPGDQRVGAIVIVNCNLHLDCFSNNSRFQDDLDIWKVFIINIRIYLPVNLFCNVCAVLNIKT